MKLTVFPSDKGDCTLITGADGKRILADGGMESSFAASVAPQLSKLARGNGNKKLDVVYVSHIDEDHIAGVLQLMDDLMAWAIHDHHLKKRNAAHKAPKVPRPPNVIEIWHNGFKDLLQDNAGPIEDQLAANATIFSGFASGSPELSAAIMEHQDLAASVKQAVKLSRRIADGQLGIKLNRPAKGRLLMVRKSKKAIKVGGMRARILAPFAADLEKLREDWDDWLRKSQDVLAAINARARDDESELTASESERFLRALLGEARITADALDKALKKKLGARSKVTPPNLASLMLLISEGKKTLLMTGDGHADEIVAGLKHNGFLTNGGMHVDVMKVPHHGAADNMTDELAMAVTADHYVFCGNGFKENPEVAVIQRLFDARVGPVEKRSGNAEASRPFTFWFNCSGKTANKADQRKHMQLIEKFVKALVKKSKKKLRARFLAPSAKSLDISL
jgi:beta-lactamase superfamily II metal-dependent hydrolase